MGSAPLVLVNREKLERYKRMRKPAQKGLEYQISLLQEKQQKLESKMEQETTETEISCIQKKN